MSNKIITFRSFVFYYYYLSVYEKGHKNSPTLYKPVCTCNKVNLKIYYYYMIWQKLLFFSNQTVNGYN